MRTLCFILLAAIAVSTSHGDTATAIPNSINFAAYDSEPWYIRQKGDKITGIIPHYTQQLTRHIQQGVNVVPMPFQRIVHASDNPNIDFIASIEHPDLFKNAYPYIKLGKIGAVIYSQQALSDELLVNPRKKARIGVLRGVIPLIKKLTPASLHQHWDLQEFNNEESGLLAAQLGRLDAAILTRNSYEYLTDQSEPDSLGYVSDLGYFTVYAWLPKRIKLNHELIDMRNKVEQLTNKGQIVLDWRTALNNFDNTSKPLFKTTPHDQQVQFRDLLKKLNHSSP